MLTTPNPPYGLPSTSFPASAGPLSPPRHDALDSPAPERRRTSGVGVKKESFKDAFGATPIHALPTETLSHIFAHLPPLALGLAQLVCKHWREIVVDDGSWRTAFETYYGILEDGEVALGRRIAPSSWRAEYINRVHLLTRWSKSRTPSVTHDPQLGPLTSLHLTRPLSSSRSSSTSFPLLSTSLASSRSALSSPSTGKLSRLSLSASPTDNLGQPLAHLPILACTSFAVSPSAALVVWGTTDGSFRLVDCAQDTTLAGRAWAGAAAERVSALVGHRRAVEAVVFDSEGSGERWASVSADGTVGVWGREGRVWEATVPVRGTEKGCSVDWRGTTIVVGMDDGRVHVWTAFDSPEQAHSTLESPTTGDKVDFLSLDGQSRILVHRANSDTFDRVQLERAGPPMVTTFAGSGPLTAFALDFAPPPSRPPPVRTGLTPSSSFSFLPPPDQPSKAFGHRAYLAVGDSSGSIMLFDWTAPHSSLPIPPRRTILTPSHGKITSLALTSAVLVVGSLDGTIRVFCPLSSTIIRTFKDRTAPRLATLDEDEDRWKVGAILARADGLVAAIGGRVLGWGIEAEVFKKRPKGAGGRMSARGERVRSEYDLRLQVRESLDSLESEAESAAAARAREQRVRTEFNLADMTEDEAVAYALLLSAEQHEREQWDDLDMDGLSLDDAPSTSPRVFGNRHDREPSIEPSSESDDEQPHSLSVPSSPFLRGLPTTSPSPSRHQGHSWRPSSAPRSAGSSSKVQLSPRLGPTYGQASAAANEPVPELDMSEEGWPVASSPRSPTLLSPRSSPSPRPQISSPSPSTIGSSTTAQTPVRRGWNDVARSASASPSPSPMAGQSALTARLAREDEEMRFVIELSLAEERSRADVGGGAGE